MHGRSVLLVDDGLATGSTMRAAVAAVRRREPARIVVAVPVGSPATCASLAAEVDDVVCLSTPSDFRAVGQAYADFAPTSDDEVREASGRAVHDGRLSHGRVPGPAVRWLTCGLDSEPTTL